MSEKTLKEILDVNSDGKVDFKDFAEKIKDLIDIDNDGKVELWELVSAVKTIIGAFI